MHPREQTIFALSSGRPTSAIAMVRVSGPQAGIAMTSLAGKLPMPRMATRVLLRDGSRVVVIDDFSTGSRENLRDMETNPRLQIIVGRVSECAGLEECRARSRSRASPR